MPIPDSSHDQTTRKHHDASLISVVVPIYNEVENIKLLVKEVDEALSGQPYGYELIMVDDGSTDGTTDELRKFAIANQNIRLVLLRRNYGQTAAMHAGIQHASGKYVVTMDGDLQNDPRDIPMMMDRLNQGYDLVHGWRKNRQDKWLSRKLPSKIANWLISKVTGFPINDLGCTLKAMKTEIAQELELYGEMHRFIPILSHQLGAKSTEVITNHRARKYGETKYGIDRTFRVILDLVTVKYMLKYFASPMQLFGKIGLWTALFAIVCGTATIGMKVLGRIDMTGNPLLLASILSIILSVQFFSMGLIGEVCARIYFSTSQRKNYQVRELVGGESNESTKIAA